MNLGGEIRFSSASSLFQNLKGPALDQEMEQMFDDLDKQTKEVEI